jgi:hypothetical protein
MTSLISPPPSAPPECVDLRKQFGTEFRIARDPAFPTEHKRDHGKHPWLFTIPCEHGEIFPHGGATLAAWTDRRGGIARALMGLPCCRLQQDGDYLDGVTVLFEVADFDQVAAIIKPRRRRRLTYEQRKAAAERLAKNLKKPRKPR